MTLSDLLSLNTSLTVSNLQGAYEAAVKKLRLFPVAIPVTVTGAAHVTGFDHPAYTICGSEVALKEIESLEGVALLGEYNGAYTTAPMTVCNPSGSDFGLDGFADMNEAFTITPEVWQMDNTIICTNLDTAFFWITGYVYPYFVTAGNPYESEHRYSIQWMVDTYGADALKVDPVMVYPVVPYALAHSHRTEGDLVTTSNLEGMGTTYVELYNSNFDLARADLESAHGSVEANTL